MIVGPRLRRSSSSPTRGEIADLTHSPARQPAPHPSPAHPHRREPTERLSATRLLGGALGGSRVGAALHMRHSRRPPPSPSLHGALPAGAAFGMRHPAADQPLVISAAPFSPEVLLRPGSWHFVLLSLRRGGDLAEIGTRCRRDAASRRGKPGTGSSGSLLSRRLPPLARRSAPLHRRAARRRRRRIPIPKLHADGQHARRHRRRRRRSGRRTQRRRRAWSFRPFAFLVTHDEYLIIADKGLRGLLGPFAFLGAALGGAEMAPTFEAAAAGCVRAIMRSPQIVMRSPQVVMRSPDTLTAFASRPSPPSLSPPPHPPPPTTHTPHARTGEPSSSSRRSPQRGTRGSPTAAARASRCRPPPPPELPRGALL